MYSKENPYFSKLVERSRLTCVTSDKNTQHMVLDIRGSGLTYEVGDSVAIYPHHDEEIVNRTLLFAKLSPEELVHDQRTGETLTIASLLTHRRVITSLNRKLLTHLPEKAADKQYIAETELWQFFRDFPEQSVTAQLLADTLQPLLPRFYSIASSPKVHPDEIHLTVAMVLSEKEGYTKRGVCTHFLGNLASEKVPIYIQSHRGFTLPKDPSTPIIMVGPGTGIAPFRAFMQERIAMGATGGNWLFFGDRTKNRDFLYSPYWSELVQRGALRLTCAFSRDQEEKVYVQHKMIENGSDLIRWIASGAYLYVCGDASRMARDVEEALKTLLSKESVTQLRKEGRYLRDVY